MIKLIRRTIRLNLISVFYQPLKNGFTFVGWFSDPDFTSPVIQSINPGTSGDLVLYAKFSINQYKLTFDTKGGSTIDTLTLDFGLELTAPEPPTKNRLYFCWLVQ